MTDPAPYGRPARNGYKADRRAVAETLPRRPAHWSKTQAPRFVKPCPPEALDRDLLRRFADAGYALSLCELMDGLKPKWAFAAYERLLERGLLSEDDYTGAASLTEKGLAELGR